MRLQRPSARTTPSATCRSWRVASDSSAKDMRSPVCRGTGVQWRVRVWLQVWGECKQQHVGLGMEARQKLCLCEGKGQGDTPGVMLKTAGLRRYNSMPCLVMRCDTNCA